MNSYVDLRLKKITKKDKSNEDIKVSNLIIQERVSVILGAPGSGKSTIVSEISKNQSHNSQSCSVKRFVKIGFEIQGEIELLLLDGLDEFRAIENDKTFLIEELANKLSEIPISIKILICCRELDWYGDNDSNALKEYLGTEVIVYQIQPLNLFEIQLYVKNRIVDQSSITQFLAKFSESGLVENPQLLNMLVELFLKNPYIVASNKKDLYSEFLQNAILESNQEHKLNDKDQLSSDQLKRGFGYLSSIYFFSGIDSFTSEILFEISNESHGCSILILEKCIRSKIFIDRKFSHRTIAEYCFALLLNQEWDLDENLMVSRLQSVFVKNGKISTELRSVYGWLCAFKYQKKLYEIDPYYQMLYTDYSILSLEQKIEQLQSIQNYSKKVPYFIEWSNSHSELRGLYEGKLTLTLIEIFELGVKLKNHLPYFILNVFKVCKYEELDVLIKEFLKRILLSSLENLNSYKEIIIGILHEEKSILIGVYNKIKIGELQDSEDRLKDSLMWELYPDSIDVNEVVECLFLYKSDNIGTAYYLNKTPQHLKLETVKKIIFESNTRDRFHLLKYRASNFIEDYFIFLIEEYKDARIEMIELFNLYSSLSFVNSDYQNPFANLGNWLIDKHREDNSDVYEELGILFYQEFINHEISNNKENYSYFYYQQAYPHFDIDNLKKCELLINSIELANSPSVKKALFEWGYDERLDDEALEETVFDNDLIKELDNKRHPKKLKWELEQEEEDRKREKEKNERISSNDQYYLERTDSQIQDNYNDLEYVATFILFNGDRYEYYMSESTYHRVSLIIEKLVSTNHILRPELISTNSLCKDSIDARRGIDTLYYVSLNLNLLKGMEFEVNNSFHEYLIINYLKNSSVINTINFPEFDEVFSNDSAVILALRKFAQLLICEYCITISDFVLGKLEVENDYPKLKRIVDLRNAVNRDVPSQLLLNIVKEYNFDFTILELTEMSTIQIDDEVLRLIEIIRVLKDATYNKISLSLAMSLHYHLLQTNELIKSLDPKQKVDIVLYLLQIFDDEEMLVSTNGFQSPKDLCASFLNREALKILNLDELYTILSYKGDLSQFWVNRILHEISTYNQNIADSEKLSYTVKEVQTFLFDNKPIFNKTSFFDNVCEYLIGLSARISANRTLQKDLFFDGTGKSKSEEACRDILMNFMGEAKSGEYILTKEKYEGKNKVDINITSVLNKNFEVQVECKKDKNNGINNGVSNQLIPKYLDNKLDFGVYLIFYFGDKKNKDSLLEKILNDIPSTWRYKIKVIFFDLTVSH